MIVLILAGGKGSRLWPYSTEDTPKQFLDFGSGTSLLQKTVLRFLGKDSFSKIIISTSDKYLALVKEQIKDDCIILTENVRKNTTFAIVYALKYMKDELLIEENEPILVLPSDHLIFPEEKLICKITNIEKKLFDNKIISFGVIPNKIETGYGYIKKGENLFPSCFKVEEFVEKPSYQRAKSFLISGEYLFNSGIYAFTRKTFFSELGKSPFNLWIKDSFIDFKNSCAEFPEISIDYALMEKTNNLVVYPLDLIWSDIGSWDRIHVALRTLKKRHEISKKLEGFLKDFVSK